MGFPDGGRMGCQSLVQTAGFPYTVITHAHARAHTHTHPHTGCGYCSLFIHTAFTCCHAACKLTNPELSSGRDTKPQLLDEGTLGAMNVRQKCDFNISLFRQRDNMLARPGHRDLLLHVYGPDGWINATL